MAPLSCSNPSDPPHESDSPHGALFFILHYLPLPELLAFQSVSRNFCEAVSNDVLLWQHIVVKPPLSSRLTDEALLKITSRAEGRVKSLALFDCFKITDAGLHRVVEQNPGITELFVPRCINLSADGMVNLVKLLHEKEGSLNQLKLYGLCNIKKDHLDNLNSFLSENNKSTKPSFYGSDHSSRWMDGDDESDRPIDLELCPFCGSVGLVFDCTRDECRRMEGRWIECRACYLCIARCEDCGACIDPDYVSQNDSVCNHLLCTDCWLKLPKCNTCNRPYCKGHNIFAAPTFGFLCQDCSDGEFLHYIPEAGY